MSAESTAFDTTTSFQAVTTSPSLIDLLVLAGVSVARRWPNGSSLSLWGQNRETIQGDLLSSLSLSLMETLSPRFDSLFFYADELLKTILLSTETL